MSTGFTFPTSISAGFADSIPSVFLPGPAKGCRWFTPACGLIHFDYLHREVLLEAHDNAAANRVYADEVAVIIPVTVSTTAGEIRAFLSDPDAISAVDAVYSALSESDEKNAEDAIRKVYARHFPGADALTFNF